MGMQKILALHDRILGKLFNATKKQLFQASGGTDRTGQRAAKPFFRQTMDAGGWQSIVW